MNANPKHSVRKIPTSFRSITGVMPTSKKESQQFESTLERDLMYILKFDFQVDRFIAQPVTINYIDKLGTARTYTPDLIIYYRQDLPESKTKKPILCEVKYKDDLCQNFRGYHPKFRAAMSYAKERDWSFKVFTEEHIRGPYLTNAKFLLPYFDIQPDEAMLTSILTRLEDMRETDPQTLIASMFSDKWNQAKLLPYLWYLIAARFIGTNLMQPLTMTSRIWHKYE